MSGTAALAAARRRRAQPSGDDLPKSRPNSAASTSPSSATAPTPVSPIQVLIKHDNKLTELSDEITQLKTLIKQKEPTNPNDIEYFKTQYNQLIHEVAELKKLIMKVQSFSMENNLEIIQLKKALRSDRDKTEPDLSEEPNDI
jgi:vacuolar-type H+-ATPase subunit I/STV1